MTTLDFILTQACPLPPACAPLTVRRQPGEALKATPTAALLMREVEPAPPEDELVAQVLDALRRW